MVLVGGEALGGRRGQSSVSPGDRIEDALVEDMAVEGEGGRGVPENPGDGQDHDVAVVDQLHRATVRWGADLTIHFPDGLHRHPRVLDRVEAEIGRICAIDTRDEGVCVSYGTAGGSYEAALDDSRTVVGHLLSVLSLPEDAIVEHRVSPWVETVRSDPPTLRVIPDLS